MTGVYASLLTNNEPCPFEVVNAEAESPFLLTADHAGRRIPGVLGNLGLSAADMGQHIAWDIGIAGVTRRLASALAAPAILQTYSRLVIDCNRQPSAPSAFPEISEATRIPGNMGLSDAEKLRRRQAIFDPYHNEISRLLENRSSRRCIYIALHSFTPVYLGLARSMHVAVLYNRRPDFACLLASLLIEEGGLLVSENEPYRLTDETDYSVPVHAEARGMDYVEIEIRQDLISNIRGQQEWAERLARLLPIAETRLRTARNE